MFHTLVISGNYHISIAFTQIEGYKGDAEKN